MKKIIVLFLLLFSASSISTFAETATLVSGEGTTGYAVPDGWTSSGTVEGGSYLKFDDGTITSPSFDPHTGLSFEFSVATFGSGTNHPLTIRILNAETDAVIIEKTTSTPTSNSYISTNSPLSIGDVDVAFKIQLYAPSGKGIRLRNYSITGTPSAGGPTCSTPTFSPAAGTYLGTQNVTITTATDGATIHYTTDGTDPTESSAAYSSAISVSSTTTIKAIAVKDGSEDSEVASATYTIINPVPGYAIDFENAVVAYVDWKMSNIGVHTSGLTSAHSGSAWGSNVNESDNGVSTASITTKEKVDYPDIFTCYISKESGNTTTSTWKIQVSSDGDTWNDIASLSTMTQNTWTEFVGDIKGSGYTNVFVRLFYSGSNAKRAVDDISLTTFTPSSIAAPTFSLPEGDYLAPQNVTISCETEGATIYYTTDGTVPSESNGTQGTSVTISSTTTLKAIAIKGGDSSVVAIAEYTFPTIYSTIPDLFAAATASSTPVYVSFGNWVVTGVNGNQVFVSDGTNGFIVYQSGHGFVVGNILSGTCACNLVLYNGSTEITGLTTSTDGLVVETGGEVTPVVRTIDALGAVNTGAVVTLNKLTYNGTVLSDGINSITPSNTLYAEASFTAGRVYNVTGVFVLSKETKQIRPRSDADIVEVAEPSIALTPSSINVLAAGENDGSVSIAYNGIIINDASDFDIQFYDSENNEISTPDWVEATVIDDNGNYIVSYIVEENTSNGRNAYFKVFALGDEDYVYSNLVTISQSAPVVDYAALPFCWTGGTSSELEGEYGVSASGLGSDYAAGNAPWQIKLDTSGDYIQIKTNEVPGMISISVKMIGGAISSSITVKESSDGESFTDVQTLSISGKQNDVLSLSTTNAFDESTRYIRLVFTKGSNVGIGPIMITTSTFTTLTATLSGGKYWATFFDNANRYSLPSGAQAFTMDDAYNLYLLGENGQEIPAGTAVIIIADSASVVLTKSNSNASVEIHGGSNILKGSNTPVAQDDTQRVLGVVGEVLGFYKFIGAYLPANKAYYIVND